MYADPDRGALHVRSADEAYALEGARAQETEELADRAVREGWIHIPTNPLSDLMNGG